MAWQRRISGGRMSDESTKRAQSIIGYRPEGRPENDFYPTPPVGTIGLMEREILSKRVWEPACGDGAMARIIESYGHDVSASDIEPRNYGCKLDFLVADNLYAPSIVTNPPFKLAREFAQHALDLGALKVCLLCKLAFLETQERGDWLEKSPLKRVWVFKKRLTLYRDGIKMKNGGMIAFAWFVWERDWHDKYPVIGWI
jgi:hypothetical protein